MKIRFLGNGDPLMFIDGNVYEVVDRENGLLRVIDETGEDYLYSLKRSIVRKVIYKMNRSHRYLKENKVFFRNQVFIFCGVDILKRSFADKVVPYSRSMWLMGSIDKFYVKNKIIIPETDYIIESGTNVKGIKTIAKGLEIRCVDKLIKEYKLPGDRNTSAENWHKVRGTAKVTNGLKTCNAEVHWYQCENIGKVQFKIKRFLS